MRDLKIPSSQYRLYSKCQLKRFCYICAVRVFVGSSIATIIGNLVPLDRHNDRIIAQKPDRPQRAGQNLAIFSHPENPWRAPWSSRMTTNAIIIFRPTTPASVFILISANAVCKPIRPTFLLASHACRGTLWHSPGEKPTELHSHKWCCAQCVLLHRIQIRLLLFRFYAFLEFQRPIILHLGRSSR